MHHTSKLAVFALLFAQAMPAMLDTPEAEFVEFKQALKLEGFSSLSAEEVYAIIDCGRNEAAVEAVMTSMDKEYPRDWDDFVTCHGPASHVHPASTLAFLAVMKNNPCILRALRRRGADFNLGGPTPLRYHYSGKQDKNLAPFDEGVVVHPLSLALMADTPATRVLRGNPENIDVECARQCIEELVKGGAKIQPHLVDMTHEEAEEAIARVLRDRKWCATSLSEILRGSSESFLAEEILAMAQPFMQLGHQRLEQIRHARETAARRS